MVHGESKLSVKRLATGLIVLAVCTVGLAPAQAKKKPFQPALQMGDQSPDSDAFIKSQIGAFYKISEKDLDTPTATLLWQCSHKPELMNLDYLKYFLGNPDPQTKQIGARSNAYYWYNDARQKRCELYQEMDKPGEIVESVMILHLPHEGMDFDDLTDALGPAMRNFFDQEGDPTKMYCFVPNTTLSMGCPPNTFAVRKATISYLGAPLPKPNPEDLQIAHDSFINRIQKSTKGKPINWNTALSMAKEQVKEHPFDAGAHVALAQALKQTGAVHDAISEYKLALTLNKYDEPVRLQAIQGLKDLYVLPKDYGIEPQGSSGVAGKAQSFAGRGIQN